MRPSPRSIATPGSGTEAAATSIVWLKNRVFPFTEAEKSDCGPKIREHPKLVPGVPEQIPVTRTSVAEMLVTVPAPEGVRVAEIAETCPKLIV
jgi:hypothetical protein